VWITVKSFFLLVVVDVVARHDLALRGLPGLAGAQDDAHDAVAELVADLLDRVEAGMLGLHHDVHEHDGDVGMVLHQPDGTLAGVRVEEFEGSSVHGAVVEREARDAVDLFLVVGDQDLPRREAERRLLRGGLLGKPHRLFGGYVFGAHGALL
jgi:hypothetical protein